jgi:hypothetical protein
MALLQKNFVVNGSIISVSQFSSITILRRRYVKPCFVMAVAVVTLNRGP